MINRCLFLYDLCNFYTNLRWYKSLESTEKMLYVIHKYSSEDFFQSTSITRLPGQVSVKLETDTLFNRKIVNEMHFNYPVARIYTAVAALSLTCE